jgi:hypothetical protein
MNPCGPGMSGPLLGSINNPCVDRSLGKRRVEMRAIGRHVLHISAYVYAQKSNMDETRNDKLRGRRKRKAQRWTHTPDARPGLA